MLNTKFEKHSSADSAPSPQPHQYSLNQKIANTEQALIGLQSKEGYWKFEFESDCSNSIEYALMMHYIDEVDELLEHKIANYLRQYQSENGSFKLFPGGPGDISLTTKAYYVLKLAGDSTNTPHMEKARQYILSQGGASKCNMLTRILLATFGQLPWKGAPFIPIELILLPKWLPLNIYNLSFWARTVIVPLSIICTIKPKAKSPDLNTISELFITSPEKEKNYFDSSSLAKKLFLAFDSLGQTVEPLLPKWLRDRAFKQAEDWIYERLNGEHGLGSVMPAMLYTYEAMDAMGIDRNDPRMLDAKKAMQNLLIINKTEAYCQPSTSPVWDTAFSMLALQEGMSRAEPAANRKAANWLASKQLTDEPGDWRVNCPDFKGGGGWAFQFSSPHYPDIDDTAIVSLAMLQMNLPEYEPAIESAARWLQVMQSKNGGFGAFDIDNTNYFINHTPLADYVSLIDPPTVDITARCVLFLSNFVKKDPTYQQTLNAAINFLWKEQEKDGTWFGRWGCNYIYGTWSVLIAMEQAGIPHNDHRIQQAAKWLKSVQRSDGGWGEDNLTYHDSSFKKRGQFHTSTSFQTAWALLGLLAAGEVKSKEVESGINYLLATQRDNGYWKDLNFSGAGSPGAVYFKYHGYEAYFPLWALSRYRNLKDGRDLYKSGQ